MKQPDTAKSGVRLRCVMGKIASFEEFFWRVRNLESGKTVETGQDTVVFVKDMTANIKKEGGAPICGTQCFPS